MKTYISILIALSFLIVSCQKSTDKKAQLENLKKQRDKLTEQISKLEDELAKSDTSKADLLTVKVEAVSPHIFRHYIEVQGKIDGEDNLGVSPKTIGVITNIYVKQGDIVRAGQVLAQLDDQVLQKSLQELKTQLDFANSLYLKQKTLWDQKIGSEIQYLTAKNNKESMENRLKTLLDQIEMNKIKSPINGTVEDIPVKIGQSVAPGFTSFRVINFSTIKVLAEVAEAYASKINTGDSVLIELPDLNKTIPARVTFSSKYINPINRTFVVEVRLKPEQLDFRANMIATMKINDYKVSTTVVPVNLVQNSQQGQFVFIVGKKENKVEKRLIKTGLSYNGSIEIPEGLADGDLLIISGYQDLKPGTVVKY